MHTYLTAEEIPFNKGYYAVDMTFYFRVNFSCYSSPASTPVYVRGLACHTKKVILYGGEGGVKTFYSDSTPPEAEATPCACIKAVDPLVLGSRIIDGVPAFSEPLGQIPNAVARSFEDEIITHPGNTGKAVLATLGLFTIVTLQRSVQLMIPAYDYVVPEKDCVTSTPADDPCEMFKHIKFPKDEFFPEDLNEASFRDFN